MENYDIGPTDPELIREMLLGSGYSEKAIQYFLEKPSLGSLPDANQVSEMIGSCGDTMKLFLKIDHDRIQDAKIQVLGCPGAVSSAMVAMEMIKGKTLEEAAELNDGDIFRALEALPAQKHHCISLTVKTLQKALDDYTKKNGHGRKKEG